MSVDNRRVFYFDKVMKQVDYIIVGLGIAGISFCEQALKDGKTIMVFDDGKPGATAKSGGVLNPIILKRFTAFWNNPEFYPVAKSFYFDLATKMKSSFFKEKPVLRIFKSIEEQNNWSVACDKPSLETFLDPAFIKNNNMHINAPLGYGKVEGTYAIDTETLINGYRDSLNSIDAISTEEFDYKSILPTNDGIRYKDVLAEKIVFCEGILASKNHYFPQKALIPNKGEYLIIKANELKLDELLKGHVYIIPLGNDFYKVGATYEIIEEETPIVAIAREELIAKLKNIINCEFEVVGQTVGVRPTTKDRRPVIGSLPEHTNLAFLNGLGTHGFLMAPLLAKLLYANLEHGKEIPPEMEISRL